MDDHGSIVNNRGIRFRSGDTIRKAAALLFSRDWLGKRPLANLSFGLNYRLTGLKEWAFRATNLALHWAAAITLAWFVSIVYRGIGGYTREAVSRDPAPFLVAALWALHPTATQSVTYIVQRMNVGMALFFLLSCLVFLAGIGSPRRTWSFFPSALFGILSLGFKQNAVLLPFLWFSLYFYAAYRPAEGEEFWRRAETRVWVAFLVALAGTGGFFYFRDYYPQFRSSVVFDPWGGLLTQLRVVPHYVSLYLFPLPDRLHLNYDIPISSTLFSPPGTFFGFLFLLVWIAGAVYAFRRDRIVSFGLLWFLLTNIPESTAMPLDVAFEHRLYLPSAGLLIAGVRLMTIGITKMRNAFPVFGGGMAKATFVIPVAALILCGGGTYGRNEVWANPDRFWEHEYAMAPSSANAVNERMNRLISQGRNDDAIREGERVLSGTVTGRERRMLLTKVSVALGKKGDWEGAIPLLERAVSLEGATRYELQTLGMAEFELGRLEPAAVLFRTLARLDPEDPMPLLFLARISDRRGERTEALDLLETAARLDPETPDPLLELEDIHVRRKEWAEAARMTDRIAARSADIPGRNFRAGGIYFRAGRLDKAEEEYLKIAQAVPTSSSAHYNLACVYAAKGNMEKAADHLSSALKNGHPPDEMFSDPDLASFRGTREFRRIKELYPTGNRGNR